MELTALSNFSATPWGNSLKPAVAFNAIGVSCHCCFGIYFCADSNIGIKVLAP